MKNIKYLFILFLGLILVNCSSDDDSNSTQTNLKIKKITRNGVIYLESEYYQNGKLKEKILYNSTGNLFGLEKYEYENDTTFIYSYNDNNELTRSRKYYSISSNISRRDWFNSEGQLVNYRIYNFEDTCGFTSITYYNPDDSISDIFTFEYVDGNCSATSKRYNENNELINSEEYIRDNKNLYYKNSSLVFFRLENLGSVTKYSIWDENNSIIADRSYESTFKYNSLNYPISEERVYLNGEIDNYIYEYY